MSDAPAHTSRFTTENATAEELLKAQTTGLVTLSDFRKRRAEVLEKVEKDLGETHSHLVGDDASQPILKKKKKKVASKTKLSFESDDEHAHSQVIRAGKPQKATSITKSLVDEPATTNLADPSRRRLVPNSHVGNAPKSQTKSALAKEAALREQLKTDYLKMQEAVKATEIKIPFTFYDGTDTNGGTVRVQKGDLIWLFLDRARKAGASMIGGDKSLREWARISVDDLMLVRNGIIIPHHHDFYYFIVQQTKGFKGEVLFDYSPVPTAATPNLESDTDAISKDYNPLSRPGEQKAADPASSANLIEGANDPPSLTRVVDRRWFEKHKHLYPANTWASFDPERDFTSGVRTDGQGNRFFFS